MILGSEMEFNLVPDFSMVNTHLTLPVVLYEFYLTVREERRLRVLENRILMRIFGP